MGDRSNEVKTYADDFLEKFPHAVTTGDGTPVVCRKECYGGYYCLCGGGFKKRCGVFSNIKKRCWNEPYKEDAET